MIARDFMLTHTKKNWESMKKEECCDRKVTLVINIRLETTTDEENNSLILVSVQRKILKKLSLTNQNLQI